MICTGKELCEILKVSSPTIKSLREKGMPYFNIGSRVVRYNLDDVLVWMNEHGGGGEKVGIKCG